ncbi:MAG: PAS domain-containing protein [Chloroflexi bacterium]|nr:PAS domain-containing protein [Chloroflexota bacterium]MBU1749624.1 PAS domain-containing protein [Chloroflexota bacterium]MBU1877510.1 PAS domain-containing protein [Chloroflexota bacterium]
MTTQHSGRDVAAGPVTGSGPTLRQQAEEQVRARGTEDLAALSPEAAQRLLHELRVHQIELELQNEELRQAQVELETARARYFDLYDLAPVGYVTISAQGLIREANLTAATLLGVARGDLVQQRLSHYILPKDQDIYYRLRQQLFATGTPQVCELRLLRYTAPGAVFWARLEATVAPSVLVGPDADIGVPACRVVLSDIAVRKQAEEAEARHREALRHERDFAESLVQMAQAIVLVLDTAGRIVRFNPYLEEIAGYRLPDVQGQDWCATFLPERDQPRSRELFLQALGGVQTRGHVNTIVTQHGRERQIEWYDQTLTDAAGAVVGLLVVGQDITGRVHMERERAQLIDELQAALINIKTLRGLLPICASCKKIRDDQGYWSQVEEYISKHTEAEFTHGICPECAQRLYPQSFPPSMAPGAGQSE